jgi:hypothetical protein
MREAVSIASADPRQLRGEAHEVSSDRTQLGRRSRRDLYEKHRHRKEENTAEKLACMIQCVR